MLWRKEKTILARATDFLTLPYKQSYKYWEGVVLLRKLVLVSIIAFFSNDYILQPVLIFFTITIICTVHMRITPTTSQIENVLEISSLFILLLNFIVSSFSIDSKLQLAQVPALLAVTNTTYIAILLVYILSVQFALLKGLLRKMAQKFNISLFRKPSNRLGRDVVNLDETSKDQLLDKIIEQNEEIEEMKKGNERNE